jgi:hypothetical protein
MGSRDHYDDGCLHILQNEVEHSALLLGGVGIGLACVQVNMNLSDIKSISIK